MSQNPLFRTLRSLQALALLTGCLALPPAPSLHAQSPFNTLVIPKRAVQLQLQSMGYAAPSESGGWVWGLPAVAAGLGNGIEVSVGASIIRPQPVILAPMDVTLAAKWRVFAAEAIGTEAAIGTFAFLPTSNRTAVAIRPDGYGFAYAALSQLLPMTWGTGDARLTPQLSISGFAVIGRYPVLREAFDESRTGISLGVDQALPRSLTRRVGLTGSDDLLALSLSWVSGNSAFGYANAGLNIIVGRHTWSLGYARGNRAARNHGPSVAYALGF